MFTVSKFIFLSFYIVALPVIYEIDYVLAIWLGENVPDYTSVFLIIVLVTALVDILVLPMNVLVSAVGDIAFFNSAYGIICLSWVPIAYFALRHGASPDQVLLIGLCISLIALVCSAIIMQKKTTVRIIQYIKKGILPLFGTVIFTFFVPFFVKSVFEQGFMRVFIVTLVSVVCVLLVGLYIGLDKRERSFVFSYVEKLKLLIKKDSKNRN